jgi:uncharacterized membrane protein
MDIQVVYPIIGLCGTVLGIIGAALIIYGGFKAAIMVVLLGHSKNLHSPITRSGVISRTR